MKIKEKNSLIENQNMVVTFGRGIPGVAECGSEPQSHKCVPKVSMLTLL